MLKKIIFLFFFFLLLIQAKAQKSIDTISFAPKIITLEGFLTTVYTKDCYFHVFSKNQITRIVYKIKKGKLYLKDSNLILIFYGSIFPPELKRVYHNSSLSEWLNKGKPSFNNIKETNVNNLFKSYRFKTIKIKFDAFDYYDYKKIEKRIFNGELIHWGIYGSTIYPDKVISNNKFYILNYVYK